MELFALVFASGWASGLNAYATVFILGLMGRFAHISEVPAGFQRFDVLIVMGVLATLELVADKIAYVDSVWDTISTVIRPIAGAAVGALIAGAHGDLPTIALASVGGLTALISHLTKSGLRLAINTSPEPITNVTASVMGDLSLVGVVSLAVLHPVAAAIIAAVLLVIMIVVFFVALAKIRKGLRALRRWMNRPSSSGTEVSSG